MMMMIMRETKMEKKLKCEKKFPKSFFSTNFELNEKKNPKSLVMMMNVCVWIKKNSTHRTIHLYFVQINFHEY